MIQRKIPLSVVVLLVVSASPRKTCCFACEPPISQAAQPPNSWSDDALSDYYFEKEAVEHPANWKINHSAHTRPTMDNKRLLEGIDHVETGEMSLAHVDVDLRPAKDTNFGIWLMFRHTDGFTAPAANTCAERPDGSVPKLIDFIKEHLQNRKKPDIVIEEDEQGRDWGHQTADIDGRTWQLHSKGTGFYATWEKTAFCMLEIEDKSGQEPVSTIIFPGLGIGREDKKYHGPSLKTALATRFRCESMDEWLQSSDHFLKEGRYLAGKGEFDKALSDYNEAVKRGPKDSLAFNGLAWFRATCADINYRDANKAVELANKACELSDWKDKYCIDTLAAANADAGKFEEAVKWQTKALDLTQSKQVGDEMRQRLSLYQANKPYHQSLQK